MRRKAFKLSSFRAFALAIVVACGGSPTPYAIEMATAERNVTAGRYAEAVLHYDEAAKSATKPRDREHALYLGALLRIRAGNVAEGARMLAEIAKGTGEHAAESAFRIALLHAETNDPAAPSEFLSVAERFPGTGSAKIAMMKVLAYDDEVGPAKALEHIESLQSGPLGSSELAETLAYQRALRLDKLGRTQEARDAYVKVAEQWPYPKGALFDDSLWRASEADEKLGKFDVAIDDLERMLSVRESAHFTGSYERPRFPSALVRVAVLYRDRVKDTKKARDAFHRAYSELDSKSPLRDDALWQEAQLWDPETACDRLSTLVSSVPDSRYVPCAMQKCPRIERPSESKAPKECHAYIDRK